MAKRLSGSYSLLLALAVMFAVTGILKAEEPSLELHERIVEDLKERAEKLGWSQEKLEKGLKKLKRKTNEASAVWEDRINQLSDRLKKRVNDLDLNSASWSTINALADVGFVFELNNSALTANQTNHQLDMIKHQNELTHNTKVLEEQKRRVDEKMAKIQELTSLITKESETFDMNMQIYKRNLRYLKFQHDLINAPSKDSVPMIKAYIEEEQKVKHAEEKLIEFLRNDTGYVAHELEKHHKEVESQLKKIGLTDVIRHEYHNHSNHSNHSIKSGHDFVFHHNQTKPVVAEHPKPAEKHVPVPTAAHPILPNVVVVQQPNSSSLSHQPIIVINNTQNIIYADGSKSVKHSSGNSTHSAEGSVMQISGVYVAKAGSPQDILHSIAGISQHTDAKKEVSNKDAHHQTTPHLTAPHQTVPHQTAPHQTVPHQTVPHQTVPHQTAHDTTAHHGKSAEVKSAQKKPIGF